MEQLYAEPSVRIMNTMPKSKKRLRNPAFEFGETVYPATDPHSYDPFYFPGHGAQSASFVDQQPPQQPGPSHCYPGHGAQSASFVDQQPGQQPGPSGGQSMLITLKFISTMTKLYKIRRMVLTEEFFFAKVKSVVRGHVSEFTYYSNPDTVTFRYGDTEGAAIFLDDEVSTLNVYPSIRLGNENDAKKPRQLRNQEIIGKTEKGGMSKLATFSKMDYLRYSRNTDIYTALKRDREQLQKMTGVFITESCVLNRAAMLCPLCDNCLKMRHGGGLEALVAHLRTGLHEEDPLAGKILNSYQEKETPLLDNYEKERLSKDHRKDRRYCKMSVLEDLMRGDRTSLSMLPNTTASDYFVKG